MIAMRYKTRALAPDEAGFTLLEVMVVVGLMAVLGAMALMVSPSFTRAARADAGLSQALDAIRSAREVAISQRRNVQIGFIGLTGIQTLRVDIGTNGQPTGTTVLRTVELENRMQFRLEDGVPDTPDAFGPGMAAIKFDGPAPYMFTSEGTFVNGNGMVANGTAFLSVPNEANSARALTIMGATALIRVWRWNGQAWVE